MKVCLVHIGGITSIRGGGIASVISNIVNETRDKIDYTLLTSFDRRDFCEAKSIYPPSIQIVGLRSSSNIVLNCLRYLRKAPCDFDIVHFHDLPFGRSLIHALKLNVKGVRLVFSHHFKREDIGFFPLNNILGVGYYQFCFNYLSRIWRSIIVNSEFMLSDLKRYKACVSKAVVIPNGVSIEKIQESQPISIAGDPSFLFVGHLDWHKGVDILLRAFNRLLKKKSFQNAHLHLVGQGMMKSYYEDFVRENRLTNKVHFWNSISQNVVFRLLKSCDVFVLPSRYEAFGIVLLEAMAAEKPIISTKVGGVPEILTHNRNGLLIQPKQTALTQAMEYLSSNEDLMETFSKNNRKDVAPFSWKNISEKYVHLYKSIVNV